MAKGLRQYQGGEVGNILFGLNGYGMVYNDGSWHINGKAVGSVGDVTIDTQGTGYDEENPPSVTFTNHPSDTTGYGATAVATVNGLGRVTAITITDPGQDYQIAPLITIDDPTSGTTALASVDKLVSLGVLVGSNGPTSTIGGMTVPYASGGLDFNGAMLPYWFTAIKNVSNATAVASGGRVQVDVKSTIGDGSDQYSQGWVFSSGGYNRFYIEPGQILYGNFIAVRISSSLGSNYKPRILLYY
jgi:hypothetical protein